MRYWRDWSSDVCSSDLQGMLLEIGFNGKDERGGAHELGLRTQPRRLAALLDFLPGFHQPLARDEIGRASWRERVVVLTVGGGLTVTRSFMNIIHCTP